MGGVLNYLGLKHMTDKASRGEGDGHNYLVWYEKYLEPLRNEKLTIFEVGVGSGYSLFTWRDYFVQATVIGFDQSDMTSLAEERIKIEIGDQGNASDLTRAAVKHAPLNIVIDDGSHEPDHQILTYKTLMPYIISGGLYILEDATDIKIVEFLKQMAHDTIATPGNTFAQSGRIESISFYRDTTITCLK